MSEDFFGDLGKSISRATQNAVGRTSTFFESTKISAMISSEQKDIDKMYQAVGETVVNNAGDTGIVELDETIMDLISEIRVCQGRIHELKKELAGVRGMKVCPACHELVPAEVAFCPQCGEAMPVEEENASIAAIASHVRSASISPNAISSTISPQRKTRCLQACGNTTLRLMRRPAIASTAAPASRIAPSA